MKKRIDAFLIHISLSIVVAIIALLIVFLIWYPAPLHEAMGVTYLFMLLLAVDVVIGPVITFIIYTPKKRYLLLLDLSIIALVQVAALSYGLYAIYQGRPAYVIFSKDRFETVSTVEIDQASKQKALKNGNQLANASWFKPRWIAVTPPLDFDRVQELVISAFRGGADLPQLPEFYTPLAKVKSQILKKAKPLNDIRALYNHSPEIEGKLKGYAEKDVKWLPLLSKSKAMLVLIDAHSAKVIGVIDINPWP